MSSEALSPDDEEAADSVWGLQDLAPAAECFNRRRRLMYLEWGCKKKKSAIRFRGKGKGRRERISPTTPLPTPNPVMSPDSQWLEMQNNLIQSLSSTKAQLERSVEEAKRRYEILKEKNSLLKNMQAEIAMKQEQPNRLQRQRRRRPALDLNMRSPPAEEAMLTWQQRKVLSAQARKERRMLMKAKSSSLQKLAVINMS